MAGASGTLYIGVTNDLRRRVHQHQQRATPGFTRKYVVTHLVHAEEYEDVTGAISREKHLKNWRREKKVALIESQNPDWRDLSLDWH